MSKVEKMIEELVIIGKNGTGKEWSEVSKLINSKVDEYYGIKLGLRLLLQLLK